MKTRKRNHANFHSFPCTERSSCSAYSFKDKNIYSKNKAHTSTWGCSNIYLLCCGFKVPVHIHILKRMYIFGTENRTLEWEILVHQVSHCDFICHRHVSDRQSSKWGNKLLLKDHFLWVCLKNKNDINFLFHISIGMVWMDECVRRDFVLLYELKCVIYMVWW